MKALVYVIMISVLLSACADRQDSFQPNYELNVPTGVKPSPRPTPSVQKEVNLDAIQVTCRADQCPPAVGVLIFLREIKGGWETSRCTAFLISSTQVMTAGHCDLDFESAPAFFITRSELGAPNVHSVSKNDFKTFTKNVEDARKTSGEPDVAIYHLAEPITGISPLPIAQGPRVPDVSTLRAYEVNEPKSMSFVIDAEDCLVHRHERYFPYDLSELPRMLTVFDCPGEEGNSGSPLLNQSGQVEAVLAGGLNGDVVSKQIRAADHRPPEAFEAHNVVTATNLRCLKVGDQAPPNCADTSDEAKQKRFLQTENQAISSFVDQHISRAQSPFFQFKPISNQLQTSGGVGLDMELTYYPKCRTADLPSAFPISSELVRLSFDEWAAPRLSVVGERRESSVQVKARLGDVVTLQVNWASPFGKALKSSSDPRSALGNSFSIALPVCSR